MNKYNDNFFYWKVKPSAKLIFWCTPGWLSLVVFGYFHPEIFLLSKNIFKQFEIIQIIVYWRPDEIEFGIFGQTVGEFNCWETFSKKFKQSMNKHNFKVKL